MQRARAGTIVGFAAAGGLIAFGAANCASPTQIIVSVRAEPSLCNGALTINESGIAVTTPEKIDDDPLDVTQDYCPDDGELGELTIAPRDDDAANVGIRVVAALGKKFAAQCTPDNTDGCIIQRRTERFLANQTVRVEVFLSQKCVSAKCGDRECDPLTGQCVDKIQSDGAVAIPPAPKRDGSVDGSVDANGDPCAACEGSCDPDKRSCIINCAQTGCLGKTFVGDLSWEINCTAGVGACTDTHCVAPNGQCAFSCGPGNAVTPECAGIGCAAGKCVVTCSNIENGCSNVRLDGGLNIVSCGASTGPTCNDVSCSGSPDAGCQRECAGIKAEGCGLVSSCQPDAGCQLWQINDGGL